MSAERSGSPTPAPVGRQDRLVLAQLDPCPECGRSYQLDLDSGHAVCVNAQCSWAAFPLLLWELLDHAAVAGPPADRNPAGRPRPRHRGLAVPWVTPVTEHGPHWRLLHRGRLAAAQRDWLCQVCGLAADPEDSVLVVNSGGWCLTSAPLHPGACTSEATSRCPAIARAGRLARIRRGAEQRSGWICPELGSTERWRIPLDHTGLSRPEHRGTDF